MNSLNFLSYTCKAPSWKEVATVRAERDLDNLDVPRADILGATPCADFTGPAPAQFFLAQNRHGLFLINTEGYTYARYALRIEHPASGHSEAEACHDC